VVSAQKPTNVTHVLKGHFISETELNLIICKSTRLEFHTLTEDGLVAQFDLGIYGRVATCKLYKPSGEPRELLFVVTERRQYFVLGYDPKKQSIKTRAKGQIQSRINRPNENGQIGIIDPDGRVIGLNLFQGQFDVIPMDSKGQLKDSFNIRLEEINVIDIQFLYGYDTPVICVLYEDNRKNRSTRHIKTYSISLKNMEFTEGPWSQPNVDLDTNMIIPVPEPIGGVLIMGLETIAYRNGRASGRGQVGTTIAIPIKCGLIRAYAPIDADGLRWLLCDEWGGLHVLALQVDKTPMDPSTDGTGAKVSSAIKAGVTGVTGSSSSSSSSSSLSSAVPTMQRHQVTVVDLSMEFLGETSIASSIAYLDNGYVFIGSSFGDSQLIHLSVERDPTTKSYVEVVQTCPNLGPIVDFCVVDLDRQGQCQVVTCSGGFKDGSLRVVRNGIGIDEQCAVEFPGIQAMWSLRGGFASKWDQYLVQTFTSETRVLAIEDDELSEVDLGGFIQDDFSLCCSNMVGDHLLQVTRSEARIVSCANPNVVKTSWKPPSTHRITVASANATQVLLALNGGKLILFEIDQSSGELMQKSEKELPHEVACLSIHPLDPRTNASKNGEDTMMTDSSNMGVDVNGVPLSADLAAVGMWTGVTVRLLVLPTLEEVHKEKLTVETIPRSLLFVSLEGRDHLLAGLGDGKLFTFDLNRGAGKDNLLSGKKKISLGSRPISLSRFRSKDVTHVFAGSDRPTVIYSSGSKLLYSNVNQREVTCMASFNAESFPESLALASEEDLTIGTINEIQKLHIRPFPLGEQPRRICHHKDGNTGSFAVCTMRSGDSSVSRSVAANGDKSNGKISSFGESSSMDMDARMTTGDDEPSNMVETNFVRLIDDQTFDVLDSFQLDEFETGCSITSCTFYEEGFGSSGDKSGNKTNSSSSSSSAGDGRNSSSSSAMETEGVTNNQKDAERKQFIVVGTAYPIEGEQEPTKGRILVFQVAENIANKTQATPTGNGPAGGASGESGRKLILVAEKQTRGAVYSLNSFNGKLLAGINSEVMLFAFSSDGPDQSELVAKGSHNEHILALYVQSRGDFIVVGDLMNSVSLLVYRGLDDSIEEIARDYNANWMTAVGILDDDTYIGTETHMNLFTVQKNSEAATEEARHMLRVVGEFHIGEFVNRFHHGSLVMKNQDPSSKRDETPVDPTVSTTAPDQISETIRSILTTSATPEMLFSTVNGVIGVIASLTEPQYKLLKRMERALGTVIEGVGGLKHDEWRSFTNDRKQTPAHGFIDGDLIEGFLELDTEDAQTVVDLVNGTKPLPSGEDISPLLSAAAASNATDSVSLNLDVESLTRFVEDLARLH